MRAEVPPPSPEYNTHSEHELDMQPLGVNSEVTQTASEVTDSTIGQITMAQALQPPLELRRSIFRGEVVKPKMDAERWKLLEQRLSELREMGASENDIKTARSVYRKGISLDSIVGRGLQTSLRTRLGMQTKNR